jgi:hypothetical protein
MIGADVAIRQSSKQVELKAKELRARFSDYENAVTLISSLEAWFQYRWGEDGEEAPGLLEAFDRFPCLDGLTPDFLVRFKTPYLLCGEYVKTFRTGHHGRKDLEQVLNYARWKPAPTADGVVAGYDVMVLVSTENDDVAAKEIRDAIGNLDPSQNSAAPVVVIGQHLDRQSANGEWFKLKWRTPHNEKFSRPNVSRDPKVEDLNVLLVENSGFHPIPVSAPVVNLAGRCPLINDAPPAFYTAARLLLPALNELLTEEERDELQLEGRIVKKVTRDEIMQARIIAEMTPQPRHMANCIQAALDFLVADVGIAKVIGGTGPAQYSIALDRRTIRDPREMWSTKAARTAVRKLKSSRGSRGSGRGWRRASLKNYPRLFEEPQD